LFTQQGNQQKIKEIEGYLQQLTPQPMPPSPVQPPKTNDALTH